MPKAPSIEDLAAFFAGLRDQYQVEQARLGFERQTRG